LGRKKKKKRKNKLSPPPWQTQWESHLPFKEDGDATALNNISVDRGRTSGDLTVVAEKPLPVNQNECLEFKT